MLGWLPDAFWQASLTDIADALEGYVTANSPARVSPPSAAELADLMKRYPDQPA